MILSNVNLFSALDMPHVSKNGWYSLLFSSEISVNFKKHYEKDGREN